MDVNAIFAAANAISEARQKRDELERLRQAAMRRCGGCFWWMKSRDCPKEHNVKGQTRGPSSGGAICGKFRPTNSQLAAEAKYEEAISSPPSPCGEEGE